MTQSSPQHAIRVTDLTIGQHDWRVDDANGEQWTVGDAVEIQVEKTGETLTGTVGSVEQGDFAALVEFPPYEGLSIPEATEQS